MVKHEMAISKDGNHDEKKRSPHKPEERKRMDELNPRQLEFIRNYVDPKSETFGSAYASAIKAGFSESYASQITTRDCKWMDAALARRVRMLDKAEGNLDGILDLGPSDTETLKVVADVSKFITKTLGKDNGWSDRTELTGKGGTPIAITGINYIIPDGNHAETDDKTAPGIPDA